MQKTQFITFIIIVALLLTVLTFVGILAVRSRSSTATDSPAVTGNNGTRVSYDRQISGQTVIIRRDQGQDLVILQVQQPVPEPPTAVPDPPVTVEELLPTAVPPAEVIIVEPTAVPPQADIGTGGVQTQGGGSSINLGVEPIIFVAHTVQAGNTLYSLARNNNTTIELMATRGISTAELIPGRVIQIPVPNPAYCLNTRPRVVHSGDTAFSLARHHGLSLEQFRIMNNLDASYALSIAQVVCVP